MIQIKKNGLVVTFVSSFCPGRIVWPQVHQICTSQTEKFSRYTLILYFSPIQSILKELQKNLSDRPKIMEKFSQPADENGHVLLPGILCFIYVYNAISDAHIIYGSTTLFTNIITDLLLEIT